MRRVVVDHDRSEDMEKESILGKKKGNNILSRRGFFELAGISTVMAGGTLVGCAPQQSSELASTAANSNEEQPSGTPSFLVAPDPVDEAEIEEVIDTEVLVIGAGITGISAARSAAESGAKVIVVEKGESYGVRSSKYGAINSSIHNQLSLPYWKMTQISHPLTRSYGYSPHIGRMTLAMTGRTNLPLVLLVNWLSVPTGTYLFARQTPRSPKILEQNSSSLHSPVSS